MKVSTAFRNAWKAYTASFGETLKFFLVEACLTLICLAPLLGLAGKAPAWIAWACPVLWIFVMLPARMNAARGMKTALQGGPLGGQELISPENYGEKLACGLKRMLFLLLWGAPLIAAALVIYGQFSGEVDSFTVLRTLKNLGGGDYKLGILAVLLVIVAALLLLTFGCAFHSGARHAWAQGDVTRIRGHHGKILLAWLASLVCVLPMIAAVVWAVGRYVPVLQDLNGLLMRTVKLPSLRETEIILAAGAVLTLPLLPLRSLIPAAAVEQLWRERPKASN